MYVLRPDVNGIRTGQGRRGSRNVPLTVESGTVDSAMIASLASVRRPPGVSAAASDAALSADGDCRCVSVSVASPHTSVAATQAAGHRKPLRLPNHLVDKLAAFLV
jgi:hypothetical protein